MWPLELLDDSAWRPLTWTLLHFLWQGMLVASVWKVLFRLFQARGTQFQYLLGLGGMFMMAACPIVTFVLLQSEAERQEMRLGNVSTLRMGLPNVPEGIPLLTASKAIAPNSPPAGQDAVPWRITLARSIRDVQPYLLSGWIMGLAFFSGRLLFGVAGTYRLGRGRRSISGELANRVGALAHRMGLGSVPKVFAAPAACEAFVVGLLRPMILLPAAWLTEMTPEVLEAVIAHELAHIRRFDLWVNLFQRLVETLLFYHPAVWWLSRRVRLAREMCCDESAALATGDRVIYAIALELAARKRLAPAGSFLEVALGVTRMTLLNRVRNVLGIGTRREQGRWWPAAVLALLVLTIVCLVAVATITWAQEKAAASAFLRIAMAEPTLTSAAGAPDRERFEIYKNTQQQLLVNRMVLEAALRKPEVAKLPTIEREQKAGNAIEWLKRRLQVSFPGRAEIMQVSVSCDDSREAVILVNEVVRAYLEQVVNAEQLQKRERLRALDNAQVEKETLIRAKRNELKALAKELGTADIEILNMQQKLAMEQLAMSRQELAKLKSELRRSEMELRVEKGMLEDASAEERRTILRNIKRFELTIAVTVEQAKELQNEVEQALKKAERFGNSTVDLEMLREEIRIAQAGLSVIANDRQRLLVELNAPPRVSLLQMAQVPQAPDK